MAAKKPDLTPLVLDELRGIRAALEKLNGSPASRPLVPMTTREAFEGAITWRFDPVFPNIDKLAECDADAVLMDYTRDGTEAGVFTAEELVRVRRWPDFGQSRPVIALMTVSDATDYIPEASEKSKFAVRVEGGWDAILCSEEWKKLLLGSIDKIIAAGFDGICFVDATPFSDLPKDRREMAELIISLSDYARSQRPGLIVMIEGGLELIPNKHIRETIDGILAIDLLYGRDGANAPNDPVTVDWAMTMLSRLDKPVVAVEYLSSPALITRAKRILATRGFHLADLGELD